MSIYGCKQKEFFKHTFGWRDFAYDFPAKAGLYCIRLHPVHAYGVWQIETTVQNHAVFHGPLDGDAVEVFLSPTLPKDAILDMFADWLLLEPPPPVTPLQKPGLQPSGPWRTLHLQLFLRHKTFQLFHAVNKRLAFSAPTRLLEEGADPNGMRQGTPILIEAIFAEAESVVTLLLESRADVDKMDATGKMSPLVACVLTLCRPVAGVLVRAHVDTTCAAQMVLDACGNSVAQMQYNRGQPWQTKQALDKVRAKRMQFLKKQFGVADPGGVRPSLGGTGVQTARRASLQDDKPGSGKGQRSPKGLFPPIKT